MSAKFETGDKVKATKAIVEGRDTPQRVDEKTELTPHVSPDSEAEPYENGWVHARSGSVGRVLDVEPSRKTATVLFKVSETVVGVHFSNLEESNHAE